MNQRFLSVLTIFAALVLLVGFAAPRDANTQDLDERITALEKQVKDLKTSNQKLELSVNTHQDILAQVFGWFRELNGACVGLAASMDTARQNGFEKAGPNPRAKTAVLDGVKGFAQALQASNPAPTKRTKTAAPTRGRNNRTGRRERSGRRERK